MVNTSGYSSVPAVGILAPTAVNVPPEIIQNLGHDKSIIWTRANEMCRQSVVTRYIESR